MSDQIFLIIAIFLVVEILSQMMKLENLGKIFVQFYVTVAHLLIAITLLTYESRELIFYFVSLIALVNTLRYLIYKIPDVQDSRGLRFFLDLLIIGALVFLLINLEGVLPFEVNLSLSETSKLWLLIAFGAALLYEMIQRALDTGLNIRDFYPNTLFSLIFVTASIIISGGAIYVLFLQNDVVLVHYLYEYLYLFTATHIAITVLVEAFSYHRASHYSLMYVMPTFVTLITFISIFIL